MFCSKCGKELSENLTCCPYCTQTSQHNTPSHPFDQPKKKSKLPLIIIAIVLVAAIAAGAILLPGLLKKDDSIATGNSETVTVWALTCVNISAEDTTIYDYKISYNEKGDKQSIVYTTNWEGANTTITQFEYDENGRLAKTVSNYENGTERNHRIFTYNADNRLIKVEDYHPNGYNYQSAEYEYDANGNQISHTDSYSGKITYEYNEKNQCIKETHDTHVYTYEYDADGNKTKVFYNGHLSTEYIYSDGNLIKEIKYADGEEIQRKDYTYDSKGRPVSGVLYEYGDKSITLSLEHDKNGNCIKKTLTSVEEDFPIIMKYEYVSFNVSAEKAEEIKEYNEDIFEATDLFKP